MEDPQIIGRTGGAQTSFKDNFLCTVDLFRQSLGDLAKTLSGNVRLAQQIQLPSTSRPEAVAMYIPQVWSWDSHSRCLASAREAMWQMPTLQTIPICFWVNWLFFFLHSRISLAEDQVTLLKGLYLLMGCHATKSEVILKAGQAEYYAANILLSPARSFKHHITVPSPAGEK